MKNVLIVVMGILLFTGCSTDLKLMQPKEKEMVQVRIESAEYRILPQDRLEIILFKNPQQNSAVQVNNQTLGQTMSPNGVLVNSKGYITMPLIGRVKIGGLTQSEAAKRITDAYRVYLKTPSIYLEVMNKRVYVIGEVNKPGVVPLDREKMTLLEAIAYAGDMKDYAVRDNIIILSTDTETNNMVMRSVDLTNFDTFQIASLMLNPNDIVYVQPDGWKQFHLDVGNFTLPFQALGQILNPFVQIKVLSDYSK